jgi:hypothetical protein
MPDIPRDDRDLPKYKRRGFMEREYSLYYGARLSTRIAQRYGNNDDPIAPIDAVQSVRPAHQVSDDIDPSDLNDI